MFLFIFHKKYELIVNMPTRQKSRKRKLSRHKMRKRVPSTKIVDPPFARTLSKGTIASPGCCGIDYTHELDGYHYQNYENVTIFLETIVSKEPTLGKDVYLYKGNTEAFLEYNVQQDEVTPLQMSPHKFEMNLKQGIRSREQFIPIILNLIVTREDNHANILIVNKKTKNIELFEPHGARTSSSELGGVKSAYKKKVIALRKYFKDILPKYRVVNVVDAVRQTAFQMTEDPKGHTGFCVTWSILYSHYRFLNPSVPLSVLVKYIHHKINARYILRYAKYIETIVKDKSKFDKHLKK